MRICPESNMLRRSEGGDVVDLGIRVTGVTGVLRPRWLEIMVRGEEDGCPAEGWWTMRKGRERKGEEDGGQGCGIVSPENGVWREVGICGPWWFYSTTGAEKTKGRKSDAALAS
ncbi:hypothetical protein HAX54_022146 [Datura stramonium]|uniref:Uncharacterized protein n=1 Tax=Datura stramonium TaxID=4076 RepID=A0ABS8UVV9_DATST|nr:hypothetical protein [Datura stramonium]